MTSPACTLAGTVLACLALVGCQEGLPATRLATAARRGDLVEIDRLVVAGANVHEHSHLRGWPPVIHAIHKGQRAALVRLLEHGASVAGPVGKNALLMASGYGDVETVKVLLSHRVPMPATDGAAASLMTAAVGGAWDIDYEWTGCERHAQVVRALLARDPGLRSHLPNRSKGMPYSPASLAGAVNGVVAGWFVRHKGCHDLVRMIGD